MNPELPQNPREEMELRVTALLLGELSAEEAAAVREAVAKDPELSKLHEDLKETIQLVRTVTTSMGEPATEQAAPLQLSEGRRQMLLTSFVIPPLKPSHRRTKPVLQFRFAEALAVLAIIAVLVAMLFPADYLAKRPAAITALPGRRAEEEMLTLGVSTPEPAVSGLSGGQAGNQALSLLPVQSVAGVDPANVVGDVNGVEPSSAEDLRSYRISVSGQVADPRGNVSLGEKSGEQSQADFQDYLKRAQRNLAAGHPAFAPAASVAAPAPTQPQLQIVLPSLMDADTDGLADDGARQKDQSAVPVALYANGLDSIRSLDRNGRGPSGPTEAPVAQKRWTISSALRGFYDDNVNTSSATEVDTFGFEISPSIRFELPMDQTSSSLESAVKLQPAPVANVTSVGDLAFGTVKSDELERGRAGGTEAKLGEVAAEASVAPERFYRFSPGGGGGGGAGRGDTVTLSEAVDKVPVLGDLPVLGRAFKSEPGEAARTREIAANDFSNLGLESAPAKPGADKQAWFDANNPRDGSTVNAGALALGLPSIELQKELPADSFYAGDMLTVNGGHGVPGQQAFGFEVADNSAGVPVKPSDAATIVLPATPATKGVDELAVSRQADTRLSRRPAPDGGVTAGALVQEARQLSEEEVKLNARRRVFEVDFSEAQQAGITLGRQIAQKQNEAEVLRQQLAISDIDAAETAPTPSLEAETLRRYQTELNESKTKLADLETSVANSQAISPERLKQVESVRVGVEKLQELMDNARELDLKKSEASRPYYNKKRELESLRTFERILGTKLAAERIDLTIPRTTMVDVAERAEPAKEKTGGLRGLGVPIGGSYASSARVAIDRDVTDIEGVTGSRSTTGYDPYYIQTQFEIIQSEVVLGKVVESLDLNTIWGKEHANSKKLKTTDAIGLLRGKLELKPVKGTGLVEIRAKDANPEVAANIANAVAEVYTEHRMQGRNRLSMGGIKVLEERYQEQLEKITKVQEEVEALRQSLAISDVDAGGTAKAASNKVETDAPLPRKAATNVPIPQPEIQSSENAFSTFSLNVSDVSFKLAAASLEKGQMPDAASVRSEEFINAFDYRDSEPMGGAPVAFAWERARYPFAHNRDLLRFSLKTAAAGRQAGRPLNVVLLLDNSGSMERADRVQIIREALAVLASQLQPQDKLSVITFARTPRLVADGVSGDKAGELAEQVSDLTPQGGTNLEDAMNLAYATAARHYLASGINRVVLLTDGAANLGNVEPESLKPVVEAQRKQGIALDCFGIGWEGFNDDLLEVLSRNGDGRYGFINSPEEAATDFVGQLAGALKVAASDVKVQVEFNPKRVTAYRQIGYAKHQLTKEQFRDNTVDAAEIAAQEAGNALYTVEVNPAGEGPLCTVRVRYKIPGTTDYREQAWDVPFAGNAAPLEHSSATMRLAASASAFSEWLVASPFAGEVTPDRLLGFLGGVPEVYGADARPKKLEWMIRQAKSLEGK